ncbi:MAG: sodium-dependent bicarbonate transport family permease [Aquabacterium sp.]
MLLLGALLIGVISGPAGAEAMKPFTGDLFKGLLAFFLLDMGLLAARQLPSLRGMPKALFAYALLAPLVHAVLALTLARMAGINQADGTLLAVLAASASYIAVPAVLRHAVPEARPALYVGLSLGLTFPFNLLVGIPLYQWMAAHMLG